MQSKKQYMQKIISLSVILHYIHYWNPNFKRCHQDTRLCVVVNVLYLPKLYIPQYYHGMMGILKNLGIKAKMLKTKGLGKKKIVYMKHIKIMSCHMGIIFTPKHLIWQRQQCVHIHSNIMHYHTGNVSCNVVPNVQALIFLTKKQIINIPTLVHQLFFTFII